MSSSADAESGSRRRTRRAILSAAASVLARDRTATLADIAEAAEVGRTTLHRYFPDRDGLLRATIDDSIEAIEQCVDGAALEHDPPLEAMRALITAMVGVGDRLMFLFGDPRTLEDYPSGGPPMNADDPTIALIERGQAHGVFDAQLSAVWIRHVLWALVYTGAEQAAYGRLPRHAVASTVIRTFENGIVRTPAA
jgi:AcrR family transcriptional regulator